jgi:hypothetical protein
MRKLPTGEPCAGEPHARFGGRGRRKPFPDPYQVRSLLNNIAPQILPIRILFFDQLKLPGAVPLLDLFFSRYRGDHIAVQLVID